MDAWAGFFEVQAEVSASLVGLVFIGLSISFARIIGSPHLPNRALEALLVLFQNLILASLFLVPGQPPRLLAAGVLIVAGATWVFVTRLHTQNLRLIESEYRRRATFATAFAQVVSLAWLAGGGALLWLGLAGVLWLVPAFLLTYALTALNAWVLLVEINR